MKIILQTMFSLRNTTFCFISSSKHTFTGTNDDRTYSDREVLVWNFLFQHTLIVTQVFIANVINGCFPNYCFHNLRCAAYSRKIKISKIKENNILGHMNDVSCFQECIIFSKLVVIYLNHNGNFRPLMCLERSLCRTNWMLFILGIY